MAKNKFDWAKQYEKEGFSIFSSSDIKSLRMIQKKYTVDYRKFFMALEEKFGQARFTKEQKTVSGVLEDIDDIVASINSLLSVNDAKLGEKVSKELFNSINKIEGAFLYFSKAQGISKATKQRIADTEEETGQTIKGMSQTSKQITGRMQKLVPKASIKEKFKEMAPELYGGISNVGAGLAYSILGPFAGLGKMGLDTFKGISAKRKSRDDFIAQQKFTESVMTGGEKTPESIQDMQNYLFGRGKGKIPENINKGEYTNLGNFAKSEGNISVGEGSQKTRRTGGDIGIVSGLTNFYRGPAFSTPYTKRLLAGIENIAGIEGGGGEGEESKIKGLGKWAVGLFGAGGVLSIFGAKLAALGTAIGGAATAIAPFIIGIGAAAAAGAGLGLLLGKLKIGDKTVNKHVEDWAIGGVFGTDISKQGEKTRRADGTVGTLTSTGEANFYDAVTERRKRIMLENPGIASTVAHKQAVADVERVEKIRAGKVAGVSSEETGQVPIDVPESTSVEQVPIDVSGSKSGVLNKIGFDKLSKSVDDLKTELLKKGKQTSIKIPSGFDAWNNRDPLTSALNSGVLDAN